jgi:hypothetical protein
VAWSLAAGLALGGTVLGGCTAGRSELGTGNSGCYEALPTAVSAVHGVGKLEGVRLVPVSALRHYSTHLYEAARAVSRPRLSHVCLVAFSGHFTKDRVENPVGRYQGSLAIVELSYPHSRLLATLIVARPPLPFAHNSIGLF